MKSTRKPGSRPGGKAREAEQDSVSRTKFAGYAEEMIEKTVKQSGNSGRVYLPSEWVGKHVKIIRLN